MKVEINQRYPEVATKKKLTYLDPHKKAQHACAVEADAGSMHGEGRDGWRGNGDGSNASSLLSPSILHRVSVSLGGRAGNEGQ